VNLPRFLFIIVPVAVLVWLGGCATPHVQPAGRSPTSPVLNAGYALMNDGYRLPVARWGPRDACNAVILALHGLNDYRNAFVTTAEYLNRQGVTVYAYDQRGFGGTEGFGYWHGSERLTSDLRAMASLLRARHPDCPLYVLGESMGGAVALSALRSTETLDIDGLILVAPAVWSRETMPLYQRMALWLAAHTMPAKRLTGKGLDIKPSDNIEMLRGLGRDPLVIKATRVDVLYGVSNLMDTAAAGLPRTDDRVLLLYGMRDDIIPKQPTCRLLRQLPDRPDHNWQVIVYENGYHMLTRDLQAERVLQDMADWLTVAGREAEDPEQVITRYCADNAL